MCLFVLISGPLGWAALIFLLLAVLVLVVVNMKLMQVVRCVCGVCVGGCVSHEWALVGARDCLQVSPSSHHHHTPPCVYLPH